jgi:hypothetical protein
MFESGTPVKLNAPLLDVHGQTGTVLQVKRDPDGVLIQAQVQIDGSGERRWLHRLSLAPISSPSPDFGPHPLLASE